MRRTVRAASVAQRVIVAAAVMAAAIVPAIAWAGTGGTNMPWNTPFQALLDNLSGPTARVLAGIMLVIGGAVWGFTRHEEGAKKIGQAIFGIAIMFGAVQIVAALAFAGATV
jgi:type IV secretory pathway VirB2 component (pilin)